MPNTFNHHKGFYLHWEDAGPPGHEVDHYQVVISPNSNLSSPVVNTGVSTLYHNATGLNAAATYYFRVTAVNAAGSVNWDEGIVTSGTLPAIAYIGTPNGTPKIGDPTKPYGTLQSGYNALVASGAPATVALQAVNNLSAQTLNMGHTVQISAANASNLSGQVYTFNSTGNTPALNFGSNTSMMSLILTGSAFGAVNGGGILNAPTLNIHAAATPSLITQVTATTLTFVAPDGAVGNAGTPGADNSGANGTDQPDAEFPSNGGDAGSASNGGDGSSGGDGQDGTSLGTITITDSAFGTIYAEAGDGGNGGVGGAGGNANGGRGGNGGNAIGPSNQDGGDAGNPTDGAMGGDGSRGGSGGDGGVGAIINLTNVSADHLWRRAAAKGIKGDPGAGGSANAGSAGTPGTGYGTGVAGDNSTYTASAGTPGDPSTNTGADDGVDGSPSTYNDNGGNTIGTDHTA